MKLTMYCEHVLVSCSLPLLWTQRLLDWPAPSGSETGAGLPSSSVKICQMIHRLVPGRKLVVCGEFSKSEPWFISFTPMWPADPMIRTLFSSCSQPFSHVGLDPKGSNVQCLWWERPSTSIVCLHDDQQTMELMRLLKNEKLLRSFLLFLLSSPGLLYSTLGNKASAWSSPGVL